MHGTFIDEPIVSNDLFSPDNDEGLVPLSDEDGSDEERSETQPVGYQTEIWKPTRSSVGPLTFDVVKALSDRTGCTFSINTHRNEARIYGGELSDALSRLDALEAILVSLCRMSRRVLYLTFLVLPPQSRKRAYPDAFHCY
jgi:hypothetical protein